MSDNATSPTGSEWLYKDGAGQADLVGKATRLIRAQSGVTEAKARAQLIERAARSRRNVVVLAAELVYAESIAAVAPSRP